MGNLRTIRARLALGFVIGPVILAIIGWIVYANTAELGASRALVTHTYQVIAEAKTIRTLMVDAETGQRGFLLTGADSFLDPYHTSLTDLNGHLTRITELTSDSERQQARLQTLKTLIQARLDQFEQSITGRRQNGLDTTEQIASLGRGKKEMDGIRAELDQIEGEENNLLARRDADADRLSKITNDWIIYGTLGSFLILAVFGIVVTRSITRPVKAMVDALSSASAEILAGTTQQAAGMREQNSAVTETVATVDEVLQTAEQMAQRALAVSETSQRAAEVGQAGRKAVDDSLIAMGVVKDQTGTIAEGILALAGQAQSIGDIIASVNDIAEQINLLSLNAAIEASRAGEHGRGFNVVASEIKALADQSKRATAQVRQILGEIQKATNAAVMVTEQGSKGVTDALKTITEAGTTIRALAEVVSDAADTAAQIAASAGQQTTGMRQIHQAMQNINQVSAQNLAATSQSEQAIQHLNSLGAGLKDLVA